MLNMHTHSHILVHKKMISYVNNLLTQVIQEINQVGMETDSEFLIRHISFSCNILLEAEHGVAIF